MTAISTTRSNVSAKPPCRPMCAAGRAAEALDHERYQTVYAAHPGAMAAPTAGFHFTPGAVRQTWQRRGIERTLLTLHVGPGTFQPVRESAIEQPSHGRRALSLERRSGGENQSDQTSGPPRHSGWLDQHARRWNGSPEERRIVADEGIARLYIRPGDRFRVLDALITNFHLPGSTPLILVAAFAGLDGPSRLSRSYREKYRFYSYGDAMLIL